MVAPLVASGVPFARGDYLRPSPEGERHQTGGGGFTRQRVPFQG